MIRNHPHWNDDDWDSIAEFAQPPLEQLDRDDFTLEAELPGIVDPETGEVVEWKEDGGWSLVDGISNLLKFIGDAFGGILGGAFNVVTSVFGGLIDGVIGLVGGIANGIAGIFRGPTDEDWQEDPGKVFSPITKSLEESVGPILDIAVESLELGEELQDDMEFIAEDMESKIGEQGTIVKSIEDLNEAMQRDLGDDGALAKKIEKVTQDLSEASSNLSGEIEGLADATEEEYQALNDRLWGDQGELNELNIALWDDQSNLNLTLSEFKALQLTFNDETTGFMAQQQELWRMDTEWKAKAAELQEEQAKTMEALQAAQNKTNADRWRVLTPYMNGGEDEHFKIDLSAKTIVAKGSWTGHMLYTGTRRQSTSSERSPDNHSHNHDDVVTVAETIPRQNGARSVLFTGSAGHVQYMVTPGVQRSVTKTQAVFDFPARLWTEIPDLRMNLSAPGDHIINLSVWFDAATRGDEYGIEIGVKTGSNWRAIRSRVVTGLGPATPLGNGHQQVSFLEVGSITQAEVDAGGYIGARIWSTASNASQRRSRSSSVKFTYIEVPEGA